MLSHQNHMKLPKIIQGGMGVAISDWNLAKAVSQQGQLGVVSGTGIAYIFAARLMDGDIGGHMQRALKAFPFQETVTRILEVMPADKSRDLTEYFGRIRSGKEYDLLKEMNQSLRTAFDECKGLK